MHTSRSEMGARRPSMGRVLYIRFPLKAGSRVTQIKTREKSQAVD